MSELDRGYLYERTQWDALERYLAEDWEKCAPKFLPMIINRHPTKAERFTAASLLQWLGTNVGFSFLLHAFRKAGYSITGHCPQFHPMSYSTDPLLNSMAMIREMDNYLKTEVAEGEREAAQEIFDLSEPT